MKKSLLAVVCASFLISCGGSNQDLTNRELVQDVQLVPYEINEVNVKAEFIYENGTVEVLERKLDVTKGDTKDKILKTLEDRRFVLVINEKRVNIAVDAGGNIAYNQEVKKEFKGCELKGKAEGRGTAENIEFNLKWQLEAELVGEGCHADAVEDYVDFQNEELGALNLFAVTDLLGASNRDLASTNFVKMEVQVRGKTN